MRFEDVDKRGEEVVRSGWDGGLDEFGGEIERGGRDL